MNDRSEFFAIQTATGWGQVLDDFAGWCRPQAGWRCLDVGCGPGLLPALLSRRGCQAFGVDADPGAFRPQPIHPAVALAAAERLPFAGRSFDLVTASNVLFLLPEPAQALKEMTRLARPGGWVAALNPSERMSVAAASALAERRGLEGVARQSLLGWAARAEENRRWAPEELAALFAAAGLELVETALKMGPGLARWARGRVVSTVSFSLPAPAS